MKLQRTGGKAEETKQLMPSRMAAQQQMVQRRQQ